MGGMNLGCANSIVNNKMTLMALSKASQPTGEFQPTAVWPCTRRESKQKSP
jgi:hypothetical protein